MRGPMNVKKGEFAVRTELKSLVSLPGYVKENLFVCPRCAVAQLEA